MLNPSLENAKCVNCLKAFEMDDKLNVKVGDNMQVVYYHAYCEGVETA